MGSNAEVFIFDHETYLREVVPTFIGLFRENQVADWLRPFLKRRQLDPQLWDSGELARFGDSLNPDLSCRGPYDLKETYDNNWKQRWSASNENSAPSEDLAEQINWLFEIAVSVKCLGASQFVGRSKTVSHYAKTLSELGVKDNDRIAELLAALGKRGFIIGYQFGFGFEGINGWLDATEAAELANRLGMLPLPRYEVSFAAMARFRMPETRGYAFPGFTAEEVTLSMVRTTASLAAADKCGLLWGNQVMPAHVYLEPYGSGRI